MRMEGGEGGEPLAHSQLWSASQLLHYDRLQAGTMRRVIAVSRMLREQWIRAKYERNEFEFIEKQEPYTAGTARIALAS